jgi:hypothetical protein
LSLVSFWAEAVGREVAGSCFVCDREVHGQDRGVAWRGADANGESAVILFHANCALHFLLRFTRDLHELDLGESLVPVVRDPSKPPRLMPMPDDPSP